MNKICPVCNQQVEESFTVHNNKLEPFTSIDPIEGLIAWGGYGVLRTVLCQTDTAVHFKFDHSGAEHLVFMKFYQPDAIAAIRADNEAHPQPCGHEGCTNLGAPCYLPWEMEEPNEYLCAEHEVEEGYCSSCHTFAAGTEGFDFEHKGLCDACASYIDEEIGLEDGDDDYDWEYPGDFDLIEGEETGLYIGPENDTMGGEA
jgi:hypothetical protein